MYFLFKDPLLSIYQIRKTFEQEQNFITPLLVLDFEFWDAWETCSLAITLECPYWKYFAYLALFNLNTLPTDLNSQQ